MRRRNYRLQNVRYCLPFIFSLTTDVKQEKFQARLAEREKLRIADAEKLSGLTEKHKQEQEQAVKVAAGKLRAGLQNPSVDTPRSLPTMYKSSARHVQELNEMEARLVAKHEEELKSAVKKTVRAGTADLTTRYVAMFLLFLTENDQMKDEL